jgi:hypothetical protein
MRKRSFVRRRVAVLFRHFFMWSSRAIALFLIMVVTLDRYRAAAVAGFMNGPVSGRSCLASAGESVAARAKCNFKGINKENPRGTIFAINRGEEESSTLSLPSSTATKTNQGRSTSQAKKWDRMLSKLEAFRQLHGHACVPSHHFDQELYRWTRTVRGNYRHQIQEALINDGDCARDNSELQVRERQDRPRLSAAKLAQLRGVGFVWDVQDHQWEAKYLQLREFHSSRGHCRVPNNCQEYPQLGIWVRNQRREHRRLLLGGGQQSSTLNPERLRKLEILDFEWYRSHEASWNDRYRELERYALLHGHANVPQDDPKWPELGRWCMNQRLAYRKLKQQQYCEADAAAEHSDDEKDCVRGEGLSEGSSSSVSSSASRGLLSALTPTRIQRLERLGFAWHVRDRTWQAMLDRLTEYHRVHGHLNIPVQADDDIEALRTWLIRQRYEYSRLQDGLPSPMTPERICKVESAIPGFRWRARGGAANGSAPTKEDWAKLFAAMRAKGLKPGMRPTAHWFEGINPFGAAGSSGGVIGKDVWTEQDLLALWNQESDDDYDDYYDRGSAKDDECMPR